LWPTAESGSAAVELNARVEKRAEALKEENMVFCCCPKINFVDTWSNTSLQNLQPLINTPKGNANPFSVSVCAQRRVPVHEALQYKRTFQLPNYFDHR
jgi:hypothetical protein